MISVDELLYEFEQGLNSLSREDNRVIPLEDKLVFLNKAQYAWIKSKLNTNNVLKQGYDATFKRIDDLEILKKINVPLKTQPSNNLHYKGVIANIDFDDYMFYRKSYCVAKNKKCKDTLSIRLIPEDKLDTFYFDPYLGPSLPWRETISTLGDNELHIYTKGDFNIEEVYLTYLRKPKRIDKEGYIQLDNNPSVNQDCELPYYAKNDIVDLAVSLASHAIGDTLQAQLSNQRNNFNE